MVSLVIALGMYLRNQPEEDLVTTIEVW